MNILKQIFQDKDGNLSSKRVAGFAILIVATICAVGNFGNPDLIETMFYGGFICLGVTAFERKNA